MDGGPHGRLDSEDLDALVAAAQAGDSDGHDRLLGLILPDAYRFAGSLIRDEQGSTSAVHDAAYAFINNWPAEASTFKDFKWLFGGLVRFRCMDHFQAQRRDHERYEKLKQYLLGSAQKTPQDVLSQLVMREEFANARRAIEMEFGDDIFDLLYQRKVLNKTSKEMLTESGVEPTAKEIAKLNTRISRSFAAAKTYLNQTGDQDG